MSCTCHVLPLVVTGNSHTRCLTSESMMDADRSLRSFFESKRDSYPFISLNYVHICEAVERSADQGATLTFSRMNLSDVGARAAEELAGIDRETPEDESTVKRYANFSAIFTMGSSSVCLSDL